MQSIFEAAMGEDLNIAFVTGGSGLVGTHVLYDLARSDRKVRALKREHSNLKIIERVFEFYDPAHGSALFQRIEWVEGDLLDIGALEDALENVQEIHHCAALVSFNPKDDDALMAINVEGTANLINAAINKGVKRFCHVSSTGAVGKKNKEERVDEMSPWPSSNKHSAYAISKHLAEREVWRGSEEGLDVAIVNPAIIVGPRRLEKKQRYNFQEILDRF